MYLCPQYILGEKRYYCQDIIVKILYNKSELYTLFCYLRRVRPRVISVYVSERGYDCRPKQKTSKTFSAEQAATLNCLYNNGMKG